MASVELYLVCLTCRGAGCDNCNQEGKTLRPVTYPGEQPPSEEERKKMEEALNFVYNLVLIPHPGKFIQGYMESHARSDPPDFLLDEAEGTTISKQATYDYYEKKFGNDD